MATDRAGVARNNGRTRLLHTAFAVVVLVLLFTGWWLWSGHEGRPSVLARWFDEPDVELHKKAGWVLAGLGGIAITFGIRAAITFVRETCRVNRGDGRWLVHWPRASVTGRFEHHGGHFDPGQRLANIGFVSTLGTLVATGVGLTTVHGGPTFVWLARVHRYAAYVLAVLVLGHLVVASGLLPGYRGAWRAMHLSGRVSSATARRLWPSEASTEQIEETSDAPVLAANARARTRTSGHRSQPAR